MDKVKQLKLAIFERENRGEITAEERDILLEAVEEKYSEECTDELLEESTEEGPELEGNPVVSDIEISPVAEAVMCEVEDGTITFEEALDVLYEADDDLSANRIFVEAVKKAQTEYEEEVEKIVDYTRSGNYIKAKASMMIAKGKLKALRKHINAVPRTKKDNFKSTEVNAMTIAGAAYDLFVIGYGAFCLKVANDNKVKSLAAVGGLDIGTGITSLMSKIPQLKRAVKYMKNKDYNYYLKEANKAIDYNEKVIDECNKLIDACIKNMKKDLEQGIKDTFKKKEEVPEKKILKDRIIKK